MKFAGAWPIFTAIAILALIFVFVVAEAPAYESCAKAALNSKTMQAATPAPGRDLSLSGSCAATFLQTSEGEGLITALSTILIALFTATLYLATKEQGVLTRESIDEAKKSSQRQLRAYVSAIPGKAFISDDRLGVVVRIENTGSTPAFETRCLWQLDVGVKPGKADFDFGFHNPNDDPIPTFVLYPGSSHSSMRMCGLSAAAKYDIDSGKAVIRAYGIVYYTDAFGSEQTGKFFCYMDKEGYDMWLANYKMQPSDNPLQAPFKFTEGNTGRVLVSWGLIASGELFCIKS